MFKLNKVCNDCPFLKSTKHHSGVYESLNNLESSIGKGEFAHSCHKTDDRSDGYIDTYNGEMQACYGSLAMIKKMEESNKCPQQLIMLKAVVVGKVDYDSIEEKESFDSLKQMRESYEKDKIKVHVPLNQ